MADLHIVITGSQLDDAVDLLKAAILGADDGRIDLHARTSWPAATSNRDPLLATTLILTTPGAFLTALNLVDRIGKRRRAQSLIEVARWLLNKHAIRTSIIAADGTLHALDGLSADALLLIAERVNQAVVLPSYSASLEAVKRGTGQPAGRPPRVFPLLDQAEYPVWYGTNREPLDPANHGAGFSSERARDAAIHYGQCRVYIPASHKIGSTGSPWWKRLLTMTDDRLKLLSIGAQPAELFWQSMATHLAATATDERSAVIFIPGYNVSFEAAALRAAQIGFDLSVRGAMAFFSWPSRGTLQGYTADEATIEASEDAIADFMVQVVERSGAHAVHVIAHSMGNRGALRAVNSIVKQAQWRSGARFSQIILAAPDVDTDVFRRLSAACNQVARRTTLYVSTRDRAIEASGWLHAFPRAGLVPPVLVAPPIDTINVTNADLTLLGHGYVADSRDVLRDLHALITSDTPPEKRFGLREEYSETGERFWQIGA